MSASSPSPFPPRVQLPGHEWGDPVHHLHHHHLLAILLGIMAFFVLIAVCYTLYKRSQTAPLPPQQMLQLMPPQQPLALPPPPPHEELSPSEPPSGSGSDSA